MEKKKNILKDVELIKLLSLVNGIKNISEISNEVGLTYKTTFYKIKDLEKEGIIEFVKNKPTLTKEYIDVVLLRSKELRDNELRFFKFISDQDKKKRVIDSLKSLISDRGISDEEFKRRLTDNYNDVSVETLQVIGTLDRIGLVRFRPELTRTGKKFLKENSK